MHFLDEAKIYLQSGHGGAGCISFRREANIPRGGPDGGDGGRGGHIIIECAPGLNTLIDYRYQQHFKAGRGGHGMGKQRSGAAGGDIVLRVPEGTQILDEDRETLLLDITEVGQRLMFLKGGRGGQGNMNFKSGGNRSPRFAQPGEPSEERWVWLRLKLMADAGLVGLPNAGKSTFLAAVTNAKPKIADYPFTTLKPMLGVVKVDEKEFVLADIPGLIAGASEGHGLGHRFLGHIERCGVLLHLVDATSEDVATDYHTIREELAAYGHGLAEKTTLVALSKADALDAERLEEQRAALSAAAGCEVAAISAASGVGMQSALRALYGVLGERAQKKAALAAPVMEEPTAEEMPDMEDEG